MTAQSMSLATSCSMYPRDFNLEPASDCMPCTCAPQTLMHAGPKGFKTADIVEYAATSGIADWRADRCAPRVPAQQIAEACSLRG
jgi:hypothetical protein